MIIKGREEKFVKRDHTQICSSEKNNKIDKRRKIEHCCDL